jgi:septum formation protein
MQAFILASASPRRREICDLLGLSYTVIPALSEAPLDLSLPLEQAVMKVARAKAEEVAASHPGRLVLGADTVVAAEDGLTPAVLGKPRDPEDARRMLKRLADRRHRVLTGVWLCGESGGGPVARGFTDQARVRFAPMSPEDIADYVSTGEPMDKAGAYAIQGRGMRYVRGIEGDFYTVMGLPGARLWEFLRPILENS